MQNSSRALQGCLAPRLDRVWVECIHAYLDVYNNLRILLRRCEAALEVAHHHRHRSARARVWAPLFQVLTEDVQLASESVRELLLVAQHSRPVPSRGHLPLPSSPPSRLHKRTEAIGPTLPLPPSQIDPVTRVRIIKQARVMINNEIMASMHALSDSESPLLEGRRQSIRQFAGLTVNTYISLVHTACANHMRLASGHQALARRAEHAVANHHLASCVVTLEAHLDHAARPVAIEALREFHELSRTLECVARLSFVQQHNHEQAATELWRELIWARGQPPEAHMGDAVVRASRARMRSGESSPRRRGTPTG